MMKLGGIKNILKYFLHILIILFFSFLHKIFVYYSLYWFILFDRSIGESLKKRGDAENKLLN
jgi:hypothetical protein